MTTTMSELGIAEYFGIGEAVGIIATFFITLYYSRREARNLRVDLETKVLNDLDDKLHGIIETAVHKPALVRVVDREGKATQSEERWCLRTPFCTCAPTHSTCARERCSATTNGMAGCGG